MKYKHLQNAGVDVSAVSIGTWAMGNQNYGKITREESIKSIRTMIDLGVNLIDTAPAYGNGYAEQLVGEALKDGYRDKVMISTKFGLASSYLDPRHRDASFKGIMREVTSSLRNLQTDHLDFYFVHWPDPDTPIAETMAALNLLKQLGAIRFIGLSNFSREQIMEAQKYGQVDVIQPSFCIVEDQNVPVMKWAREEGIDSFTYGSLAAGALSGAFSSKPDFPDNDIRMFFYPYFREPMFSTIQELLKSFDKLAEKYHSEVSQVVLNYTASRDYVGTCLVGATKQTHAISNARSFDFELEQSDVEMLDQLMHEHGFEI